MNKKNVQVKIVIDLFELITTSVDVSSLNNVSMNSLSIIID
jgi:hypothetical protein